MAITKGYEYKEEVLPNGVIQVRRADIILEDDVEIARSYHRHVLNPGDDVTGEEAVVQAIANAVWTPEVVAAYKAETQKSQGLNA